jgi:hypothetical protein
MPELTRLISTGTVPLLSSEVPTSEDAKTGATLAVFSVQENHIVNSTSRQWVSGPFWVNIQGAPFEFKVKFTARQVAEAKRGLSFKKANGWGKMELKCEGAPPEGTQFRVAMLAGPGVKHHSLGNNNGAVVTTIAATTCDAARVEDVITTAAPGEAAKRASRREAQCNHDFGKYSTFAFSGHDEFWDFSSLVDKKKHAIFIGIEMLPQEVATEKELEVEQSQVRLPEIEILGNSKYTCSAITTTCTVGYVADDADKFSEEYVCKRRRTIASMLGPPPGLELIRPHPGLELIGPPPGLELIGLPPGLVV